MCLVTLTREGNILSLPLDMEPRTQDGSGVAVRWFLLCAVTASIKGQRSGISRKTKALEQCPSNTNAAATTYRRY